jgi:hypothetical protein
MNEKFVSALIEKEGSVSALILINNEPVLIVQTQFERKKKELVERLKSLASNESGIYACSTASLPKRFSEIYSRYCTGK